MVAFNTDTPRESITIAGQTFTVPRPYSEKYKLKANEASALNQVLGENIRNNMARKVKEGATQADVDTYVTEYEFGVHSGGGGRTSDPVESEALEIARDKVRAAIKKQGLQLKDYKSSQITEKAREVLNKYPEIRQIAAENVARNAALTDITV